MDVVEAPTNKPIVRIDIRICLQTQKENWMQLLMISLSHKKGQPVLVGTITMGCYP